MPGTDNRLLGNWRTDPTAGAGGVSFQNLPMTGFCRPGMLDPSGFAQLIEVIFCAAIADPKIFGQHFTGDGRIGPHHREDFFLGSFLGSYIQRMKDEG